MNTLVPISFYVRGYQPIRPLNTFFAVEYAAVIQTESSIETNAPKENWKLHDCGSREKHLLQARAHGWAAGTSILQARPFVCLLPYHVLLGGIEAGKTESRTCQSYCWTVMGKQNDYTAKIVATCATWVEASIYRTATSRTEPAESPICIIVTAAFILCRTLPVNTEGSMSCYVLIHGWQSSFCDLIYAADVL